MVRPRFLDRTAAEMAEWRAIPEVAELLEWMAWERSRGLEACYSCAIAGDHLKGALAAGQVSCLDAISNLLHREDTPTEEPREEKFIDPALIP